MQLCKRWSVTCAGCHVVWSECCPVLLLSLIRQSRIRCHCCQCLSRCQLVWYVMRAKSSISTWWSCLGNAACNVFYVINLTKNAGIKSSVVNTTHYIAFISATCWMYYLLNAKKETLVKLSKMLYAKLIQQQLPHET